VLLCERLDLPTDLPHGRAKVLEVALQVALLVCGTLRGADRAQTGLEVVGGTH
jgi:hypothetical protein